MLLLLPLIRFQCSCSDVEQFCSLLSLLMLRCVVSRFSMSVSMSMSHRHAMRHDEQRWSRVHLYCVRCVRVWVCVSLSFSCTLFALCFSWSVRPFRPCDSSCILQLLLPLRKRRGDAKLSQGQDSWDFFDCAAAVNRSVDRYNMCACSIDQFASEERERERGREERVQEEERINSHWTRSAVRREERRKHRSSERGDEWKGEERQRMQWYRCNASTHCMSHWLICLN